MNERASNWSMRLLAPTGVVLGVLLVWSVVAALRFVPENTFPGPLNVVQAFKEELGSGRMVNDLIVSLFRVTVGFLLAAAGSVPLGLLLGHHLVARMALLPAVNFMRNISPLAWISFAVLWFGMGDPPAVFLIFLSTFFPLTLAVAAAVANIPAVYFQVAREYGLSGPRMLLEVTLPAILPQVITALRVAAGVAWMVVVAAEMLAGRTGGLGFAVWDARNGLRTDIMVAVMIVIGSIGVLIDRVLVQMTRMRSVRWGYER